MKKKSTTFLVLLWIIILGFPSIAGAATGCGPFSYFSTGGVQYSCRSLVSTTASTANATVYTHCATQDASPGYLGGYARLYYALGNLRASKGWLYSSSFIKKGIGYKVVTPTIVASKGNIYYSQGISRGYNQKTGNYATKTNIKSPNQVAN